MIKRGDEMRFYERAFRYIKRKKNKTMILLFSFLAVSTMILCAVMILRTAQAVSQSMQEKTGTKLILSSKQGENDITAETVLRISNLNFVTEINRTASNMAYPVNFFPIMKAEKANGKKEAGKENKEGEGEKIGKTKKEEMDDFNLAVTIHTYDSTEKDGMFAQEKYRLLDGKHISKNQNGILMNLVLAKANGIEIGDVISLKVWKEGKEKIVSGEVIGIFFSGMERKQADNVAAIHRIENQIYVDYTMFEKLFGRSGFSSVSVYTDNPEVLNVLYTQIEAMFDSESEKSKENDRVKEKNKTNKTNKTGETSEISNINKKNKVNKINITYSDMLYRKMQAPLKQVIRITTLMLFLVVVTAVIVISLLLCMWMRTRRKEIAIMISLRFSKFNLFLQFIMESLSLFGISVIGAIVINCLFMRVLLDKLFIGNDFASMTATHLEGGHIVVLVLVGSSIVLISVGISILPTLWSNPRDTFSKMEG